MLVFAAACCEWELGGRDGVEFPSADGLQRRERSRLTKRGDRKPFGNTSDDIYIYVRRRPRKEGKSVDLGWIWVPVRRD